MKVAEIANKMLADARRMLPQNTANSFYWSVGRGVQRKYYLESVSCDPSKPAIAALIQAQEDRPWKGDFWLCALPAFLSEREPDAIRLMMGTQVEAGRVDVGLPCLTPEDVRRIRAEWDEGKGEER